MSECSHNAFRKGQELNYVHCDLFRNSSSFYQMIKKPLVTKKISLDTQQEVTEEKILSATFVEKEMGCENVSAVVVYPLHRFSHLTFSVVPLQKMMMNQNLNHNK